ncbi:DoxX family protein [Microcoleus sp. FACHB-672]|uniref:DoxX family protein n=1 Tax=Microcoleus sp. FACHB-672 TaxID=2692825 RepID=UPI00168A08C5|nr:DoxX family protein [Microcoleus sp. FACHB-672]MBD2039464.1 DoxX family protein [Microcoleus sp. FACHB-672]
MQKYVPLLARIFLSLIFIKAGIDKLLDPGSTIQQMASKGIPLPGVLIVPTIILLIAGGLSVLLGFKARYGALGLIGFLIPTTLIFHTNFAEPMQQGQFLKNLGLMGGLLMVVAFGSGALSVDDRTGSHRISSPTEKF